MKTSIRHFIPSALALVAVAIIATAAQTSSCNTAGNQHGAVFTTTANPDIPSSINLCGDEISLDRLDMAERLDRELTAVVYSHAATLSCFKRANRYFPIVAPILKEEGAPLDLLYLLVTESTVDPTIKSSAGAVGLWQFMPATALEYGLEVNDDVDERCDPEKSTRAAIKCLKRARANYGNWASAFASYNAGPGRINGELSKQGQKNALDLQLVSETSRYVFRIMAYKLVMENPKRYGYRMTSRQLYQPRECRTVEVKTSVASWVEWARRQGITYAQLRDANPWIRSNKLTNTSGKTYKVQVPHEETLYLSKRKPSVYDRSWVVD